MTDFETWGLRAAVTAAVGAVVGLFMRVRTNESRLAVLETESERRKKSDDDIVNLKVLSKEISTKLDYLPRHDDLQRIHDRISANGKEAQQTREEVAALKVEVQGARTAIRRLEQTELNRSKA